MRLIDWKRSQRLAPTYYDIIRRLGHSDDLNISEAELKKLLGVTNLRIDNEGYALADFSTYKNSQTQDLVL